MSRKVEVPGLSEHEQHLRGLWLELAEKRIEAGVDWPYVVRTLFRDIDRLISPTEGAREPVDGHYCPACGCRVAAAAQEEQS